MADSAPVISARRSFAGAMSSSSIDLSSDSAGARAKSILTKQSLVDVREDLDRALSSEPPEKWFQRILKQQQLSPIDLCDRFCFGDTRKHRYVPLKHVCEQLFELDPGNDPLTEDMEEFLFRFSFDQGDGEIIIDIKEALRTLDIWQTTAPMAASPKKAGSRPQSTISPAKATMLQVKAEQLQRVVENLQHENLRLSQALGDPGSSMTMDELRPPSPLKFNIKKPLQEPTQPVSSSSSSSSRSSFSQSPTTPSAVVSRHEQELINLANRLEYSGVKKLEACLQQADTKTTGFISLKQLRWIVLNECGLQDPPVDSLSESRLMELCLGMNFNAQGQLDYKEFVRVLLDILLYEPQANRRQSTASSPSLPEAASASLTKLREYLKGFYDSREKTRELLEVLCDKYDLEGNQCVSEVELTRVLQSDLPHQHPVKLKLPLTQTDTSKLIRALAQASPQRRNDSEFVYYPAILDAIFRSSDSSPSGGSSQKTAAMVSRLVQREFWQSLRAPLSPPGQQRGYTRKIHAQLCKILMKLDPRHSFRIAQRHFIRVFDQHWSTRDLELLVLALSDPVGGKSPPPACVSVRYDVLMKLLFNAPELRDAMALAAIAAKLQRGFSTEVESELASHRSLPYCRVYELLGAENLLTLTEFLYLIAHCKTDTDDRVDMEKLRRALTTDSDTTEAGSDSSARAALAQSPRPSRDDREEDFTLLRQCLRVLCDDFELENCMHKLSRHARGVVSIEPLARELLVQLRTLQLSTSDQRRVVHQSHVTAFLRSIGGEPTGDSLYIHAVMEALFDWDAMAAALQLPDRLSEVKQTLELFDWHRNGVIEVEDWAKAWRQLTSNHSVTSSPLRDWELRVLLHKFPVVKTESAPRKSLDYSRLLVFLIDRQQRVARDQLHRVVTLLLQRVCERVTQGKANWTTMHLERAFGAIDRDKKGYFHTGDLREFVVAELRSMSSANAATLLTYASQGPALEAVMKELAGGGSSSRQHKTVVSLMRFQELVNHGFRLPKGGEGTRRRNPSDTSQRNHRHGHDEGEDTSDDDSYSDTASTRTKPSKQTQITLLNDLERCVFEIAQQFTDASNHVSPTAVYAHFNGHSPPSPQRQRRPRSQSPVRHSSHHSSRRASYSPVVHEQTMDPLTASRLKQTLKQRHCIETSTHLIGQFFLHLGATTRHFLELPKLAQWLTPLSVDFQRRVKQIVKDMMVKSKSGGGQVDLERFLSALGRRLSDAQATEAAMTRSTPMRVSEDELVVVPPALLLSRLHQLNVPLRKPELLLLLRHFGMETQPEIDYAAFIRRLYELAQRLP